VSWIAINKGRETGRKAGDYKFNPLQIKVTPEMELKEVNNGRLAMWAAAGMLMQGTFTHQSMLSNM